MDGRRYGLLACYKLAMYIAKAIQRKEKLFTEVFNRNYVKIPTVTELERRKYFPLEILPTKDFQRKTSHRKACKADIIH